jgi:hypothetical protein
MTPPPSEQKRQRKQGKERHTETVMSTTAEGATALYSDEGFAFPQYLAANNGNAAKATEMMREGAAWRAHFRPDLLTIEDAIEGLERYNIYVPGTKSRQGEALVFCESFSSVHVQLAESPYAHNRSTLLSNAYVLETTVCRETPTFLVAVDCTGLRRAAVDERYIRVVTETLTLAFPGAANRFVFYSLPLLIEGALKVVWPMVPKSLKQMTQISGGDPSPLFARIADASQLPRRFGGTLENERFTTAWYIARRRGIE